MKKHKIIELDSFSDSTSSFTEFLISRKPQKKLNSIYEDLKDIYKIQVNGMTLYNRDLRCLMPRKWLNDKIINTYMALLSVEYTSTYSFSTYMYPRMSFYDFDTVNRWFDDVDLLSYEYVLIPIHDRAHWTIIIVNGCVFEYYDSLGGVNVRAIKLLRRFFSNLYFKKHKARLNYKIKIMSNRFEFQTNGDDCGMFCCMFAKYRISPHLHGIFYPHEINRLRKTMLHELLSGQIIYNS